MSYKFETGAEVLEIIDKCKDREKLTKTLSFIHERLVSEGAPITGYMWQSLCNHVSAMVDRSQNKEKLEGFEESMFDEISAESVKFAEEVTTMIGDLAPNEKFLLSVHFERAKIQA